MIPFPDKKYKIIYADPPWEYKKSGGIKSARGLQKKYYPFMTQDELISLPIHQISDKDCYLFMWATAPTLPEAINLVRVWGFNYFTVAFTWIKTNKKSDSLFWGMGNSTRANPEYVLLGRKGKLERAHKGIHSVFMGKLERHSKKPNEIRNRIEMLYGDIPRIELFAREKHAGWDVWGTEVESDIILGENQ